MSRNSLTRRLDAVMRAATPAVTYPTAEEIDKLVALFSAALGSPEKPPTDHWEWRDNHFVLTGTTLHPKVPPSINCTDCQTFAQDSFDAFCNDREQNIPTRKSTRPTCWGKHSMKGQP
jgi:hypothetical protein